jgi:hypothetical protein
MIKERIMVASSSSSLDPEVNPRPDRELGKGHGTDALGPSDTSDSGSDIHGGFGLSRDIGLGLDTGTTSDPEESTAGGTAGPDIGDANLDSDSDATGTGERATAARDTVVEDGQDIDTDRIERLSQTPDPHSVDGEDEEE